MRKQRLTRPIILPSSGVTASTFDYYIGPSGSDSNPGTLASPWAITALQTKTSSIAGKTVGLLDGTYIVDPGPNTGSNSGGIQWNATGCTVKAVNARQAIITTNNAGTYPQVTEPCIQILAANCTVDGLKFYQASFDFLRVTGLGTVIKNCHFENVLLGRNSTAPAGDNVGAIQVARDSYASMTIDNCYFSDFWNAASSDNGNCIGPLYYAGQTAITRCSFFNAEIAIQWKSYNHGPLTVNQCYFDSSIVKLAVYGLMSNDYVVPMQATFKNNVVNRAGYGLDTQNINTAHTENWTDIQHNTFVMDTNYYSITGIAYSNPLTGSLLSGSDLHHCVLRDNVFKADAGVTASVLYWQTGRNSSLDLFGTIDYNLYSYVNMRDADGVTYSTLANWRTRTGQEGNSINASATFVNSTGNTPASYALASGSGKSAASDGTDMGAWGGGVTQIGCDF